MTPDWPQPRPTDAVTIVVARPDQWRAYKAIRLEALRLEPAAYSSTYADAVRYPDEFWIHRLDKRDAIHLIARRDREPVGMAGAFSEPNDGENEMAIIVGVYVRASERGQGLGARLMAELFAQIAARFPETRTLRLWVTPTQVAARTLYARLGFREAPNTDPEAPDEIMLERALRP